jgi:hypothetical protein
MLDEASPGIYSVTSLGDPGTTMMKRQFSPGSRHSQVPVHSWWKSSQFQRLTTAKWDIIIIMLGTDDASMPAVACLGQWTPASAPLLSMLDAAG